MCFQKHLSQTDGGCFKCNKYYSTNIYNDIIEKSKIKYNDKYDFTNFKYISAKTKGELKCKKHNNIFMITPTDHLNTIYGGCNICINEIKNIEKNKKKIALEKKNN